MSGACQPPVLRCTAHPTPSCFGSAWASLSSASCCAPHFLLVPSPWPQTTLEALYLPKLFVGCTYAMSNKCRDQLLCLGQSLKVSFSSC